MAEHKINLTIGAKDNASKVIDPLAKKVDKLDGDDVEITVEAKVSKALDALDAVAKEAKQAEAAAEALGRALGPELAGRMNLDAAVVDFQRMDLTLEDITANADQLGGKLREIDAADPGGKLAASVGRAKAGVDDVGRSADSSSSALANMVGNSAQDLGALGGVAGSTGVAIGQMAEYMADASLSGEGLSSVLRNFAAVAGPIAALALAVQLIGSAFGEASKRTEESKNIQEDWTAAMLAGGDAAVNYAETLKSAFSETGTIVADVGGKAVSQAEALRQQLESKAWGTGKFQAFTDTTKSNFADISGLLADAGADVDTYTKAIAGGEKGLKAWTNAVRKSNLSASEQERLIAAVVNGQKSYVDGARFAAEFTKLFGDAAFDAKAHVDALNKAYRDAADPMATYNRLQQEGADQSERANRIVAEFAQSQQDVSAAIADTTAQWQAMSDAVSEKSFKEALDQFDALSELDLAQMRQDTVKSFDDVKAAIKTAAKEVKGWGKMDLTPDSFEELKGMPDAFGGVTDAVSGMRGRIQTELQAAFDTGGIQVFSEKFDFFAGQVREQFTTMFEGMGLPEDQVQAQVDAILADLGLLPKSKEVIIKLTRDQEAKNALDLFMSDIATIEQAHPSVDIRAKMAAGDIAGAIDELNAIRITQGQDPIVLPTDVDRVGAEQAATDARTRAQTVIDQSDPLLYKSSVLKPPNTDDVLKDTQKLLDKNPLTMQFVLAGTSGGRGPLRISDAGGTIGRDEYGLVAERRPEIVNGRYLVTSPTVVPPGTRVTSGARTAHILRTKGTRGLKRYDQGGVVRAVSINPTININAGVVGDPFAVMRAVDDANRRIARLLPTHP